MKKILEYLNRFKVYINNSIWVLTGMVVRMLITIFIISRVAKLLGTDDFGWYNLAISVFTVLFSFSALGFNQSFVIKHIVNDESSKERVLGTTIISRIVWSLVLLGLFAIWIIASGAEHNYWIVLLACCCILFQVSELFVAYYQWKLKANIYIGLTLIVLVIVASLLILGLYMKYGLTYFISIYLLERVLFLIGLLITFNKLDIKLKELKFDKQLFRSLFFQSWPLLMGAILTALYARFDQFLIKYFLSISDIGIYGTAVILSQIWYVVPSLIIPILYPKIAEKKKEKDYDNYFKVITLLYGTLNYLALGVVIFMYIFGDYIILELYGEAYADSTFILKILIWNLMILFQSHLTTSVMIIEGRERYLFNTKLASVFINVVLNIIFLASYGIVFAAYSLLISSFVSWILLAFFDSKMRMLLILNIKSYLLPFNFKKYMI